MLNKAHSKICVNLSNSTCCYFNSLVHKKLNEKFPLTSESILSPSLMQKGWGWGKTTICQKNTVNFQLITTSPPTYTYKINKKKKISAFDEVLFT